jgi:S1-C subfamily serine protease
MRLRKYAIIAFTTALCFLFQACAVPPSVDHTKPRHRTYIGAAQRLCAVVVSSKSNLDAWVSGKSDRPGSLGEADGGSAVPITSDGYFLTANHVLVHSTGRNIFLIHAQRGELHAAKARIVWQSSRQDIALLHISEATPRYYEWSNPKSGIARGTPVIHAGISTGFSGPAGKTLTDIAPGNGWRRFRHDIPLAPGDSGGPVIDAYGKLVGINSAIELLIPVETPFFIEAEANRPNVRQIERLISSDRVKHGHP